MARDTVTAAVLLIGDELLSGRTKDANLGFLCEKLTALAIEVREARVVADVEDDIVEALNALRSKYDYVFTTGGIGPTHDDITADCVAKAFGVGIDHHPEALELLHANYRPEQINAARMRMARVPDGGELVRNKLTWAPGFRLGNVFVLAGIPSVMQAMFEQLAPSLERGRPLISRTVRADMGEGDLAQGLQVIQDRFAQVSIGSYPFQENGRFGSNLVLRSKDEAALERATKDVETMVADLKR